MDIPERLKIEEIRQKLAEIPPELDTELNLSRWLGEFSGDVDEVLASLRNYLECRRLAGLDSADYLDTWTDLPNVIAHLPFFSMSKFQRKLVNKRDNCVVCLGRAVGVDYKRLAMTLRSSEIILAYFAYGEYINRQILSQEAESGRRSGVICLFDLGGLNLAECVLSGSALLHISRMCINVMQKWYTTEGLKALVFLNPPRVMVLFWQMAKLVMNDRTRQKIHLVRNPQKQLPNLLDADVIPECFGGTLRDDSGHCAIPQLCVNTPATISSRDYCIPGQIWQRETGGEKVRWTTAYLGRHSSLALERWAEGGNDRLVWIFWSNWELDFEIFFRDSNGRESMVQPRLSLTTTKLPEEGFLVCSLTGLYLIRFTNSASHFFDTKLEYDVKLM